MLVTKAEQELLDGLAYFQRRGMVSPLSEDLEPAQRAMVKRMRMKGLLSKRNRVFGPNDQAGRKVG